VVPRTPGCRVPHGERATHRVRPSSQPRPEEREVAGPRWCCHGSSRQRRLGLEPRVAVAWLHVVLSPRPAGRVLFVTKLQGLLGLDLDEAVSHVTILTRYGVPSRGYIACLARAFSRGPIEFVGDLDPLDLTVFLSLASRLRAFRKVVRYVGVDSQWIERCRRYAKGSGSLPLIRMSGFEVAHWALLKATDVAWERIVGFQAFEVLNQGFKLELEGATNPNIYSATLSAELTEVLFASRPRSPKD
jgi:hypothetical protein